jgi:hypothetical protein
MIGAKTLADHPDALLVSVHGEKHSPDHDWYILEDWTALRFRIDDPGTLPKEIQDGFAALEKQNLVGAPAIGRNESNAEIQLYLINISALNKSPPPSGKPGPVISGFTTKLDKQTILLRGSRHGSSLILYSGITQANWKRDPKRSDEFIDGIPKQMDDLITDSELGANYDPPDPNPPDPSVITCYLLNLASFTDPQTR